MTEDVHKSIYGREKELLKTYAKVKDIEYGKNWKEDKECKFSIQKGSILISADITSLDKIENFKKHIELFNNEPNNPCVNSLSIGLLQKSEITKYPNESIFGRDYNDKESLELSSDCWIRKY